MGKTGVLLIGCTGYISTAVIAGTMALNKGLCSRTGMVTELEPFSGLNLPEPSDLVFGGWDIRCASPIESAYELFRNSQLPTEILKAIEEDIKGVAQNIYAGVTTNCGRAITHLCDRPEEYKPLREQVDKLKSDIRDFKERNGLESAVVINLASTEPPLEFMECHTSLDTFEQCLDEDNHEAIRASTLYSYAAVSEGCPYLNFTPSNAALIPAILELAESNKVPVMGNDGKTGETLVKSALIPMFMYRNLEVLSWEGFNILGNMDGQVLDDPQNKESKILTKDKVLPKVLGYTPHSRVHIHYVPSLDDLKTAWNFIHFKGFLGSKMSLQFIWQGYDSILAAPLIIDLVRMADLSKRRGEAGLMKHLSSFFKAPLGVEEYRLYEQFNMLMNYLHESEPSNGAEPDTGNIKDPRIPT
ncbi:MAG: inositol-3-phosphate synthase [Deltaproteobacteria bacterium]|nr:inositol-3-phosphate synthase [Deltaproteobacteria bacterium]